MHFSSPRFFIRSRNSTNDSGMQVKPQPVDDEQDRTMAKKLTDARKSLQQAKEAAQSRLK